MRGSPGVDFRLTCFNLEHEIAPLLLYLHHCIFAQTRIQTGYCFDLIKGEFEFQGLRVIVADQKNTLFVALLFKILLIFLWVWCWNVYCPPPPPLRKHSICASTTTW